jgi:hypothetical protein
MMQMQSTRVAHGRGRQDQGAEAAGEAETGPGEGAEQDTVALALRMAKLKRHGKLTGVLVGVANRARAAREKNAKLEVQAAVNYVIFLGLFTFSILSSTNAADKFGLSSKISGLIQQPVIDEIATPASVYDYLENVIPAALYGNTFDGDSTFGHRRAGPKRGDLLGECCSDGHDSDCIA